MVNSKCCVAVLILFLQIVPVNTDIKLTDYCSDKRFPYLQTDYTGTINHTVSGKTCQNWNSNHPHYSDYTHWYDDQNHCRNHDNPTGPWCLTTDNNTRWELCDVPHCDEVRYCPEALKSLPNAPRNCQYTCHCRDKCKLDSVNGTCQFGCDHGWRGPKCQTVVTCNVNFAPPMRISTNKANVRFDTTLQVSCENGYRLVGNPSVTCQTDGTLSNLPSCQDIDDCNPISPCHHGTCMNLPGSYNCTCHPGYTGLQCQREVRCSTAIFRSPLKVNSTALTIDERYGSTLIFSCESGYELIGNSLSTCQNDGTWRSVPTCKGVRCKTETFKPPLKVNSTALTKDERYGTTLLISCESGYELIGNSLSTCQNNGTWSSIPTCKVTATYCTLSHKHNCQNEVNCSCQYLCHCNEKDFCDPNNGTCGRGECSPGWMGKSCQYANIAFNQRTTMVDRKVVDGQLETCSEQIKNVSLYFNEIYPLSALQIIIKDDISAVIQLTIKTDTNASSNYSNSYCFNDAVAVHNRLLFVYCTHVLRSSQLFISFTDRISICEIEVFGGRNIALWSSTSQYGVYTAPFTHTQYNSGLAVDGETSNDFSTGTCSHTGTVESAEEPWWMINLEPNTIVTRVKLYIRSTDHVERMSNFSVSINNDTRVIYHQHENPPPGVIDIVEPFPLTISSLKVTIPTGGDRFVSLCEVQIFACLPTSSGGENCQDFCPLNCRDSDGCINNNFQCSTCQKDWAGPFCRYRQCENITSSNLYYTNNTFTEENLTQTTFYRCNRGYNPGKDTSAVCDKTGLWIPGIPGCKPVECNALNKTTHLQILGESDRRNISVFQDELSFGCSQGYSLQGNQTLRCLHDGTWNASVPECIRIQTSTEYSSQTALIGGGLGGVVAVLSAVVVVLVIVLRRRRVRKGNDDSAAEMDVMPSSNVYTNINKNDTRKIQEGLENTDNDGTDSNIGGGVYQNVNNSRKDKSNQFNNRPKAKVATYEVVDKIKPKSPTAVLVIDFKEMLENSKLKKDYFALEFQRFLSGLQFPYEKAIELPNRPKNKYRNIYPYDKARVVLSPVSGKPDSDYINASYINGNKETRCFIAAQGPINQTINDFWRMMWQLNAGKIVMLTNLVELGKTKCMQYWPEDKDLQFPGLTVKLLDTEVFADFRIRTMTLSDGKSSRTVKQFHFTAWPDKGTPIYSSSLVHFANKVRHTPGEGNGPLVVHCSAGIGRTGTFIALEILIKQAADDGFVDVFECVASLRQQRLNMVQTLEQYIFLHHTLLEALMSPSHEIPAGKFSSVYADLLETEENSSMRKLDLQFQTLNETSPVIPESEFIIGKQSTNKAKNRYSNIIPVDSQIPKLEEIQGEEDNYINAVFLPGYKRERNFLLTQMPLSNTITDFWRLVHDYSVSTIVMLNEQPQDELYSNSADMGVYWPIGNATCSYGPFRIEDIVEESDTEGDFSVIQLNYLYRNIESRDVTLFQARFWKESEPTPSSPTSLLRFIEATETHHEKRNTGPMIVHCMNGSYKSGLFCVAKAVIESLQLDQDVRIHHVIKQMRSCRPQIIPNVEQFKFCHDLVLEFMDQFDAYSNFK